LNNDKSFQKYVGAGGGSNRPPKNEQFKEMMVHGAVHSKEYTKVILLVSKSILTNSCPRDDDSTFLTII